MKKLSIYIIGLLLMANILNCQSIGDSDDYTYITLKDLLQVDPYQITQPCVSEREFGNYISNTDHWISVLSNPDELQFDFLTLKEVRALIVAARDSAEEVQNEFQIRQVSRQPAQETVLAQGPNTPLNAFLQISSTVNLQTKVIQGLFYKEIQNIMNKLAQMKSSTGIDISEQAQEILDALDKLGIELAEVLDRRDQFDGWIQYLTDLRNELVISYNKCQEAGGEGFSVRVETADQYLDGQPSSASIDNVGEGSATVIKENDGLGSAVINQDDGLGSAIINKNNGQGSALINKNAGQGSAFINKNAGQGSAFIKKSSQIDNKVAFVQKQSTTRSENLAKNHHRLTRNVHHKNRK